MATITIKNVTSGNVYLRDLSTTIDAGETITFQRSLGELTSMTGLNVALTDGSIQLVSTVVTAQESFWLTGNGLTTTEAMTFYVSTTGSDTNTGLSAAMPLKTVSAALRKVPYTIQPGNPVTIVMAAGTYDERITCPPLLLRDNVTVQGDAMIATAPGQGAASGTFDAVFGAQEFTQRALFTGAGWLAGGLRGGFFVEILDGTLIGTLLPIVNNGVDTIDVGVPCNTGTFNLQSRQFRLVKPSTILTRSVNEECIFIGAPVLGATVSATPSVPTGGANYLTFSKLEIRRSSVSAPAAVRANSAFIRLNNCSVLDNAGGGGSMVSVTTNTVLRMDDCLLYRAASNNTILLGASSFSIATFTRLGAFGGNYVVSATHTSMGFTNGFFRSQDEAAISARSGSNVTTASSIGIDACGAGILLGQGAAVNIVSSAIKNCTSVGIGVGLSSKNVATAAVSFANMSVFNTTIDTCVRGIVCGSGASVALTGTTAINNCSAFGVDMAPSLRCGHNNVVTAPTNTMSGNGADLTVDGTAGLTLAALRALSPKRSVEATTFNRLVEV